jgi:hypothetical protein
MGTGVRAQVASGVQGRRQRVQGHEDQSGRERVRAQRAMSARVRSVSVSVRVGTQVANGDGDRCEGAGSERGPNARAQATSVRVRGSSMEAKEGRHTISQVGATIANYEGSQAN